MKKGVGLLALAVMGFIASTGACAWLLATYMTPHVPGFSPVQLFLYADIIAKLMMSLIVLLLLPILGLGIAALATGRGQFAVPLSILALASMAFGLLGTLWTVTMIQQGVAAVGPVSFEVTAPGYAEATLSSALGFFGAVLALGASVLGDRRR